MPSNSVIIRASTKLDIKKKSKEKFDNSKVSYEDIGGMSEQLRKIREIVMVTTPNVLTSLGVNPYHVREYTAAELAETLERSFAEVDVRGVGASEPVRRYLDARRRRIERIMRIDPFRLRERLPRRLIERLFALLAVVVRKGVRRDDALPEVTWRDFPIGEQGPAADDAVDLLAVCRAPLS